MTTCTDSSRTWVRGTIEYLEGTATANVELDAQPVAITLDRAGDTFIPSQWEGTGTWNAGNTEFTRTWRTVNPVTDADLPGFESGEVYVRITSTPEIPLVFAGTITYS